MSQLRRAEAYKGVDDRAGRAVAEVGARRGGEPRGGAALHPGQCRHRAARRPAAVRRQALSTDARRAFSRAARRRAAPTSASRPNGTCAWRRPSCATGTWTPRSSRRSAPARDLEREHAGAIDLTDVLPSPAPRWSRSGPAPQPEEMLFLGMPAARRMKLDADACSAALAESRDAIDSLRQALNA